MEIGSYNSSSGDSISCTNGNTYYHELDASGLVRGYHFLGDGSVIAAITIQSSNFDDVAVTSTTSGQWVSETADLGTTTIDGTTRGAMLHVGNNGAKRLRATIVCTGTGTLRIAKHGKV